MPNDRTPGFRPHFHLSAEDVEERIELCRARGFTEAVYALRRLRHFLHAGGVW